VTHERGSSESRCALIKGAGSDARPLGRPRHRWVDNIRTDLQEVGCGYMDWIGLGQDRDRWRTLVSAVMNLRVPWNVGNFLTSCKPVGFSRRTLHHGVSKYGVSWIWCPRASIQASTRLILFANSSTGLYRKLSAERLSERIVLYKDYMHSLAQLESNALNIRLREKYFKHKFKTEAKQRTF